MPAPCNCPETNQNPCVQVTPCVEPNCTCKLFLDSKCLTNISVDTPCVDIPKGLPFNEWMPLAFTRLCTKIGEVASNLVLKNIGNGAKIFKQVNILGEKELRTIVSSDNSVNIEENSDNIDIKTILSPIEKIDQGNGDGYILRGRNELYFGNVGKDSIDLSNNFNTSNRGATGRSSFAVGVNILASGDFSVAMGAASEAEGYSATAMGEGSFATGRGSFATGKNSSATNFYSTAFGDTCASLEYGSIAGGVRNTANSPGEVSLGFIGTTGTDRLFNIGNGIIAGITDIPSDAISVFKNGTAFLPSITNSLIDSANNKAIITKQYLQSSLISGTTTVVSGNATTSTPFKVEIQPSIIAQINTNTTNISSLTTTVNNVVTGDSIWKVGDLKMIDVADSYITANFDVTGLGFGERLGWAICNGNNGTRDRRGTVPIAFDNRTVDPFNGIWDNLYRFLGFIVGQKRVLLTADESGLRDHTHNINIRLGALSTGADVNERYVIAAPTTTSGVNGGALNAIDSHENRQPSMVTLFIQKI